MTDEVKSSSGSAWDKLKKDRPEKNGSVRGAENKLKDALGINEYSDDEMAAAYEGGRKNSGSSIVNCAYYGWDGTAKTGCAMDCREDDEMDMDLIVIDFDGSAGPIKSKYFNDSETIVIPDLLCIKPPSLAQRTDDIIDYVNTYAKSVRFLAWLYENKQRFNAKALIVDGLDTLLKSSEMVMRAEDLHNIGPASLVGNQTNWQNRNRKFLVATFLAKYLPWDTLYTTHLKDKKVKTVGSQGQQEFVAVEGKEYPNWESSFAGTLFQRVRCYAERDPLDPMHFSLKARVEKAKGALHLEQMVYTTAEVYQQEVGGRTINKTAKWFGMKDFYKEVRGRKVAEEGEEVDV